jgi:hypothetical protein
MKRKVKDIVNKICLGLCDGCDGRCQLYPRLAETCDIFRKYKDGYDLGLKDNKINKIS